MTNFPVDKKPMLDTPGSLVAQQQRHSLLQRVHSHLMPPYEVEANGCPVPELGMYTDRAVYVSGEPVVRE